MPDHTDPTDREAAAPGTAADWNAETLRAALGKAAEWTVDYRSHVEERPVLPAVTPGDVRRALASPLPRAPEPFQRIGDLIESPASGWGLSGFVCRRR